MGLEGCCSSSLIMGVGEYHNNLSSPSPPIMLSSYPNYSTTIPSSILQRHQAREKIMSHPYYPRLLAAYLNCQKIGAPPEMSARLEEACVGVGAAMRVGGVSVESGDPALDQFMEAYCEMLIKYEQELSKPLTEATLFLATIERQFQALTISHHSHQEAAETEDSEVKMQVLEKYRGSLGKLKQELSKKKKNGRLPKEGRQQLVKWWSRHERWPYPSEAEKAALAESTGLEARQINNWFINQRKRHWRPPSASS